MDKPRKKKPFFKKIRQKYPGPLSRKNPMPFSAQKLGRKIREELVQKKV